MANDRAKAASGAKAKGKASGAKAKAGPAAVEPAPKTAPTRPRKADPRADHYARQLAAIVEDARAAEKPWQLLLAIGRAEVIPPSTRVRPADLSAAVEAIAAHAGGLSAKDPRRSLLEDLATTLRATADRPGRPPLSYARDEADAQALHRVVAVAVEATNEADLLITLGRAQALPAGVVPAIRERAIDLLAKHAAALKKADPRREILERIEEALADGY